MIRINSLVEPQSFGHWWLPWVIVAFWSFGTATNQALAISSVDGIWTNAVSGGSWNDADTGNWSGGLVAGGINATADFSTLDLTTDNTVHLGAPRTIGNLIFGDTSASNNWILDDGGNSANILTLSTVGTPSVTVNNQIATINAVVAGTNGLALSGAGTLVLGGNNSYSGDTSLNSGATLIVNHANALGSGGLSINSAATATLQSGLTGPVQLTGLAIQGNASPVGTLDISNNSLIIHNGDLPTLTAQIKSGLNINGTLWSGTGITSRCAAGDENSLTAVGIIPNDVNGSEIYDIWPAGAGSAATTDDLVKYTYFGDADLNGVVDNATDFLLWQSGSTSGGELGGWLYGDFDYDGDVDAAVDFNQWFTGFFGQSSPLSSGVEPVPEPGTLLLVALALPGLSTIVRRRSRFASHRDGTP